MTLLKIKIKSIKVQHILTKCIGENHNCTTEQRKDHIVIAEEKSTEVVLYELLCFVHNKMDVLPQDILNKTITDFYSNLEITTAKDILYDKCAHLVSCPMETIKRSGSGKCSCNTFILILIYPGEW